MRFTLSLLDFCLLSTHLGRPPNLPSRHHRLSHNDHSTRQLRVLATHLHDDLPPSRGIVTFSSITTFFGPVRRTNRPCAKGGEGGIEGEEDRGGMRCVKTLLFPLKLASHLMSVSSTKGAGISVQAGIPDFRSETGLFQTLKRDHSCLTSGKDLFDASVFNVSASAIVIKDRTALGYAQRKSSVVVDMWLHVGFDASAACATKWATSTVLLLSSCVASGALIVLHRGTSCFYRVPRLPSLWRIR